MENQKTEIRDKNQKTIDTTWKIKKEFFDEDKTLSPFLQGKKANKQELYNHLHDWTMPNNEPRKTIDQIKLEYVSLTSSDSKIYKELPRISFDSESIENDPIFGQPIIGSNTSAISNLISELQNSDWVRQGLNYINDKSSETQKCPFCQEDTVTPSLANKIKDYFDKTYDESLSKIEKLKNLYSEEISKLEEFEKLEVPDIVESEASSLSALYQALITQAKANESLIHEKAKSPSEIKDIIKTKYLLRKVNEKIDEINKEISTHNRKLANVSDETRKLKDSFWDNLRWHYNETINALDSELNDHDKRISGLKNQISLAQTEKQTTLRKIENLQSKTVNIESAIIAINNNLKALGITDFWIRKHSDVLYKIERENQKVADITTLSEGEKTIITFLYFLELCKGKSSPNEVDNKKIVVIDDPVSSLSHIYVFNIGELIKTEFFRSREFEQVFVLTHSLYFFYELTDINDERRKETQKLHRISKNSSGSFISVMKYEEIQNDYQTYWSIVNDPQQNEALIANCMRNIIEYFFNFVEKLNLTDVFEKPALKSPRFQAFKRYINRESHSVGQNIFDMKEFNYEDFKEGLRLVFHESGYAAHYKKMSKKVPA